MSEKQDKNHSSDRSESRQPIKVSSEDLPLHCPMPGKQLWNLHPKVYLPIEEGNNVQCPYCGADYVLIGDVKNHH